MKSFLLTSFRQTMQGLALILLASYLLSCSGRNSSANNTTMPSPFLSEGKLRIDHLEAMDFSFDKYIGSYTIVKFDTNSDCNLKDPDQVIIRDTIVFVLDQNKLHIFNISGKHINTISKMGRGPDEYLQINDFDFIDSTKLIVIADHHNIHLYKLDGELIESIHSEWRVFQIATLKNNFLISPMTQTGDKNLDFNIILTDYNLNILDKKDPLPIWDGPFFSWTGTGERVSHLSDYLTYFSFRGDTIYKITDSLITTHMTLDYTFPYKITGDSPDPGEKIYSHIVYRETNSYIILQYRFQGKRNLIIQNKDSLDQYYHIKSSPISFDNSTEKGPYVYVMAGDLRKTINEFDKNYKKYIGNTPIKHLTENEIFSNGFLILFNWKSD